MKEKILKMVFVKIKSCEGKQREKLTVDRIDVIALKELYNELLELD